MGIPDCLTCLLRNLYAGQEATVRTGHGTIDWFQIGKGVRQSCILSPCLFSFCAKYIMWNAGLDEAQAGIKIARRNFELWCWRRLLSLLDSKEIQPVNPKGNKPRIITGKIDAEAESPILWPLDAKNWLNGKDPDDGKDWRREEKGMTEDEMVGWHHWCYGHDFVLAPGVGDGQGSLVCCIPWGHRVGHDWVTELKILVLNLPLCYLFSICSICSFPPFYSFMLSYGLI